MDDGELGAWRGTGGVEIGGGLSGGGGAPGGRCCSNKPCMVSDGVETIGVDGAVVVDSRRPCRIGVVGAGVVGGCTASVVVSGAVVVGGTQSS